LDKIILLTVLLAGLSASAGAQDARNPIDTTMNKCLIEKQGTLPRAECYSLASTAWDNEITTKYSALEKLIPATLLTSFRASQLTWLRYRDAQLGFLDKKEAGQRGSGHIAGRIIERMEVVRQRALVLNELYDAYKP